MQEEKDAVIQRLKETYRRWEELVAELVEGQLTARPLPGGWTVKDHLTHLWAWQQRTVARVEAAQKGGEPDFPHWPAHLNPQTEDVDELNDWIYQSNRDRSWESVYQDWRRNFRRLIEISETLPAEDLMTVGRFPWWKDYALAYVLTASCDHHKEHDEMLQDWLYGTTRTG
jgi:hypothetical protein